MTQQISQRANDFIVAHEVTDQQVYERIYQSPTWPSASSGVTIGIGSDLSAYTAPEFRSDWHGHIPQGDEDRLAAACGLSGIAAGALVKGLSDIAVPWAAACAVFTTKVLPRYVEMATVTYPGLASMPPDCIGALTDLTYNRGASMADLDRRREMRQIRAAIINWQAHLVPGLLRAMSRLWVGTPDESDMTARRNGEADMFQSGLDAMAAQTTSSTVPAVPAAPDLPAAPQTSDQLNNAELARLGGAPPSA